jgi:hypothetical protein
MLLKKETIQQEMLDKPRIRSRKRRRRDETQRSCLTATVIVAPENSFGNLRFISRDLSPSCSSGTQRAYLVSNIFQYLCDTQVTSLLKHLPRCAVNDCSENRNLSSTNSNLSSFRPYLSGLPSEQVALPLRREFKMTAAAVVSLP